MLEPCPGCGALFAQLVENLNHPYIGASADCWALFAALVAGQTPDADLIAASRIGAARAEAPAVPDLSVLPGVESLLVDAYAAQHHGESSPQAIQSVAVHLLTLRGVLECNVDPAQALWVRRRALRTRGVFHRLTPPPLGAALSIRHLFPGGGVDRPCSTADYVVSVYTAWSTCHAATLADWYTRFVLAD
ncbi:MAG: DUF5946 family protein [Litorilinea sp.]